MQQDYYSVLARLVIPRAEDDSALRQRIYATARERLRQRIGWDSNGLNPVESAEQLVALESAIARIEEEVAGGNARRASAFAARIPDRRVEIIPPGAAFAPPTDAQYEIPTERTASRRSSPIRSMLPFVGAAIVAIVAYIAVERAVYTDSPAAPQSNERPAGESAADHRSDLPLPDAYGVYALQGDRLTELQALPVRVPDHGAAITTVLLAASKTRLPSGPIQFVAFQRELANSAPEKVAVRVVAHVRPGSSTDKQEATTDSWAVRSISYEMKVAPVADHPAIIVMRPIDNAFVFPAGRYALMLKGTAYDFSVNGPITDPAQCVERSEGLNVIDYLPCR